MKRIFEQRSELQVAKGLIVHVLFRSYNVSRPELRNKRKETQQWSLRVAHDIELNQVRVYHERVYADNVLSKIWFVRCFSSQHYSKFITNITSENKSQIRTKGCKTWSFLYNGNPNTLRFCRHFNCDSVFAVIVSFLNESVHGFNIIRNGRVPTRFQTVFSGQHQNCLSKNMSFPSVRFWYVDGWCISENATSHWHSRFSSSGKKFVKKLSVLSRNSCADALKTNTIVNEYLAKWLWSILLDKI